MIKLYVSSAQKGRQAVLWETLLSCRRIWRFCCLALKQLVCLLLQIKRVNSFKENKEWLADGEVLILHRQPSHVQSQTLYNHTWSIFFPFLFWIKQTSGLNSSDPSWLERISFTFLGSPTSLLSSRLWIIMWLVSGAEEAGLVWLQRGFKACFLSSKSKFQPSCGCASSPGSCSFYFPADSGRGWPSH